MLRQCQLFNLQLLQCDMRKGGLCFLLLDGEMQVGGGRVGALHEEKDITQCYQPYNNRATSYK